MTPRAKHMLSLINDAFQAHESESLVSAKPPVKLPSLLTAPSPKKTITLTFLPFRVYSRTSTSPSSTRG